MTSPHPSPKGSSLIYHPIRIFLYFRSSPRRVYAERTIIMLQEVQKAGLQGRPRVSLGTHEEKPVTF